MVVLYLFLNLVNDTSPMTSQHHPSLAVAYADVSPFEESTTSVVAGAEELRYAAREIGKISAGGTIDVEDVLDSIFREFCIGK